MFKEGYEENRSVFKGEWPVWKGNEKPGHDSVLGAKL